LTNARAKVTKWQLDPKILR